ncbi:MAG: PAS domain S-box protein [Flexistipes sinusarabici]|uniref:histidine kinase n=2 Tax=Flexistipes sinusarabici TaxID=2352 RepID=A0A5D0MNS1_FLESI|nr:MAG: PAS domain S-box protein [Flexistipes sinusarabici]
MSYTILTLSIIFQLGTALLAFRLIKKTGRLYAWAFIAAALLLMVFRRLIPLYQSLSVNGKPIDPAAESVAMLISILLFFGVLFIGGIFEKLNKLRLETEDELEKRKETEKELLESEERYRGLVNKVSEGILVSESSSMKIVFANPTVCNMLGYSNEELRDMTVPQLHPAEYKEYVISDFQNKVKGNNPITLNIPCLRKDGEIIYVDIKTSNYKFKNTDYILGLFSNVTERRKAEGEQQRIENLEKLGNIAAGIAHDFNNLFTGIYGNIEIAKLELPNSHPALTSLTKAQETMDKSRELTSKLLTFAKGGGPVPEIIPLEKLVRETVSSILADCKTIKANFSFPDDLWPVKADRDQTAQVFNSLTHNAVEAMPDGGRINISAENVTRSDSNNSEEFFVKIIFSDEGSGIPLDKIDKIFDPFYTTKQIGKGLGLSVVHSIINKHKGQIQVNSKPGKGTAFTIFLPAASNSKTAKEKVSEKKLNILFMDDDEMLRKLAAEMLNSIGHSAVTASKGKQAVEIFRESLQKGAPFDMLIMDLSVKNGKGANDVIGEILEISPEAKVIITSGYASDPVINNYKDYGFCETLIKPFNLAQLEEKISKAAEINVGK